VTALPSRMVARVPGRRQRGTYADTGGPSDRAPGRTGRRLQGVAQAPETGPRSNVCSNGAMDDEQIAGRYRLLDRHAIGGMATVWRARDEWTGETVAIKRLHPHVVADPVARARLEREAEALRAVDHPAIVRPRELIDDPEAPSLVMDFVSGRPLDERIAEGPLPVGEAVAVAGVIADALAVAHARGIVHRDIKPANIVVEDDGAVHLVDFGIAALMDTPVDDLTAASTMIGTLRYAAPERLAGDEVTARTDVWALGAVLYEMLTGRPAVTLVDPAGALAASRAAPPALDGLPPALATVIARAMAVEPDDRYPDAIALRDALAEADPSMVPHVTVDPDAATAVVPLPTGAPAPDAAPQPVGVPLSLPLVAGLGAPIVATVPPARSVPSPDADPVAPRTPASRDAAGPPRPARRWMAVAVAGIIAAAALFAVAGPAVLTGVGAGPGQGEPSDAAAGASPSARPSVSVATPLPTPDPNAGPGKGKGKGKGKGNGGD
jgi:tRNA A-37 threonylcarbamoyl transferase component Bud32